MEATQVCQHHHLHHVRSMVTLPKPPSLRPQMVRVRASAGRRHCEFSSLNAPLEPRSLVGRFLGGVLQNRRQLFHLVVKEELKMLSDDRESAFARMVLSQDSDEALLHSVLFGNKIDRDPAVARMVLSQDSDEYLPHRRIAHVKENESMIAVADVMYLLILYKFSGIRVHMVPKLSSCLYNGRLEILPSKDWDLESIHSMEVLDIVREHVSTVTSLKPNPSVRDSWETTPIRQFWLARVYTASILYGYFLKSVSLRYNLEQTLSLSGHDRHHCHKTSPLISFHDVYCYGSKDVMFGNKKDLQSVWHGLIRQEEDVEDLNGYVEGFQPGSFERCAKLRSKEAVHLVVSHSNALFGNKKSGLSQHDDVIVTSFSSLRRLLLEAVAFGSFLWETEDYIDNVYKLKDPK